VCELLAVAIEYGATRLWRRLCCGSEADARSLVGAALSARCGVAFVREQAHLLECRLHRAMPCARNAAAVRERQQRELQEHIARADCRDLGRGDGSGAYGMGMPTGEHYQQRQPVGEGGERR
jgi:hypothetical protein